VSGAGAAGTGGAAAPEPPPRPPIQPPLTPPGPAPGPAPAPASGAAAPAAASPQTSAPPADADAAIERARAAYEYGDIDEVVTWARQVAEGKLHPTTAQRIQALRYLGIGLYLTGRTEGAETAFFELLRLRPGTRLDPKTTRPDVVTFFENVRRRHGPEINQAAREANPKTFVLNFVPPIGQFQNGHRGRGYTIGTIEALSLASSVITAVLLNSWEMEHQLFGDRDSDARALKTVNALSVAVLVLSYAFGVIDGIAHYGDLPEEPTATTRMARLRPSPGGVALEF
jgi:hypothetical protein